MISFEKKKKSKKQTNPYIIAVLRSRSRRSQNYLGPGAGAGDEIKFLINIFCSQFGECYDEDKLISTSISIVLLF